MGNFFCCGLAGEEQKINDNRPYQSAQPTKPIEAKQGGPDLQAPPPEVSAPAPPPLEVPKDEGYKGSVDRAALLTSIFNACDFDNSGKLSLKEYSTLAAESSGPVAKLIMESGFKIADGDSDKQLTKDEFIKFNIDNAKDDTDADFQAKMDAWCELAKKKAIGWYVVKRKIEVSDSEQLGGNEVASIEEGNCVYVLEVLPHPEFQRVRARIKNPAGFTSVVGLGSESDKVWLQKDEASNKCTTGWYLVKSDIEVSNSEHLGGKEVATVKPGNRVYVLEVMPHPEFHRVRAKVKSPAGFTSIVGLGSDSDKVWMERDEEVERAAQKAFAQATPGWYVVKREIQISDSDHLGGKALGTVQEGKHVYVSEVLPHPEFQRVRAKIKDPAGFTSLMGLGSECDKVWLEKDGTYEEAMKQYTPGWYLVKSDIEISNSEVLHGKEVGTVEAGKRVFVLEVLPHPELARVRAKVKNPAGFTSIVGLGVDSSKVWLQKDDDFEEAMKQYSPGWYIVKTAIEVSDSMVLHGKNLGTVEEGKRVYVEETMPHPEFQRLRAQIRTPTGFKHPTGFTSVVGLGSDGDKVWLEKDEKFEEAMKQYTTGWYVVKTSIEVSDSMVLHGKNLGTVEEGKRVYVEEMMPHPDFQRLRAKIKTPTGFKNPTGFTSVVGLDSDSDKVWLQKDTAFEEAMKQYTPGWYVIKTPIEVSDSMVLHGKNLGTVETGKRVYVEEMVPHPDFQRLRAKIKTPTGFKSPTGFTSVVGLDSDSDKVWLQKDAVFEEAMKQYTPGWYVVKTPIEVSDSMVLHGKNLGTVEEGKRVYVEEMMPHPEFQRLRAKIKTPSGFKSPTGFTSVVGLDSDSDKVWLQKDAEFDEAMKQYTPGWYLVKTPIEVSNSEVLHGKNLGTVEAGKCVYVEEVFPHPEFQRVRAKIKEPAGFTSVVGLDSDFDKVWLLKQA